MAILPLAAAAAVAACTHHTGDIHVVKAILQFVLVQFAL
jgi:hypothetical protein